MNWKSHLPAIGNGFRKILEAKIATSSTMGPFVFDGTTGLLFGLSLGLGFGQDLGDGHGQGVSGLCRRASLALGFDE